MNCVENDSRTDWQVAVATQKTRRQSLSNISWSTWSYGSETSASGIFSELPCMLLKSLWRKCTTGFQLLNV